MITLYKNRVQIIIICSWLLVACCTLLCYVMIELVLLELKYADDGLSLIEKFNLVSIYIAFLVSQLAICIIFIKHIHSLQKLKTKYNALFEKETIISVNEIAIDLNTPATKIAKELKNFTKSKKEGFTLNANSTVQFVGKNN